MFGGYLYACGGTSLVLVYRVALWPWTITCPRPALSILVFPGMLDNIALPICFWDEPLWPRRPCSLTCFSPFHSQAMGKKESRDPRCLAAVCKSPELHRRGWELLRDSSSSCTTSLTAGVKLWVTGYERPCIWDTEVLFSCWSKQEQQLTSCSLLGPPSKNTCYNWE